MEKHQYKWRGERTLNYYTNILGFTINFKNVKMLLSITKVLQSIVCDNDKEESQMKGMVSSKMKKPVVEQFHIHISWR